MYRARMKEGEFYAIETFGSTGRGFVVEVFLFLFFFIKLLIYNNHNTNNNNIGR